MKYNFKGVIGQERVKKEVSESLNQGNKSFLIWGFGSIGKLTMARGIAHALDKEPIIVCWRDSMNKESLIHSLSTVKEGQVVIIDNIDDIDLLSDEDSKLLDDIINKSVVNLKTDKGNVQVSIPKITLICVSLYEQDVKFGYSTELDEYTIDELFEAGNKRLKGTGFIIDKGAIEVLLEHLPHYIANLYCMLEYAIRISSETNITKDVAKNIMKNLDKWIEKRWN